jgi:hypothetical protein
MNKQREIKWFFLQDVLFLLFAGSVYMSALVFNDAWQNTGKLCGFGMLVVLYFTLRMIPQKAKPSVIGVLGFMLVLLGLYEAILGFLQLYGFMPSKHTLFRLTGTFFQSGTFCGISGCGVSFGCLFLFQGMAYRARHDRLFHGQIRHEGDFLRHCYYHTNRYLAHTSRSYEPCGMVGGNCRRPACCF